MSNQINVNDLVLVIKPTPCCGDSTSLGGPFTVVSFSLPPAPWCRFCGCTRPYIYAELRNASMHGWAEIDRLKRIPPLSELEGEKNDSKLTEPA